MVLKLVYENGTGRVLGAQAVGGSGVDKRLDVVATVSHFGGTVHDLARLDLAYAPPFGSAKDPVHMVAFAAENDLAGVARLLPPDADLSGFQVVDVRSAAEVAALPLANAPHARHIPLEQLRDRIAELDASKPTVVSCQTGLRSHVGTRILAQRGFAEVWNLSGAASVRDLALNRRTPPKPAAGPVTACGAQPAGTCGAAPAGSDAETISPDELGARVAAGTADVVDVRTGAEFRSQHLKGARHVALEALTADAVRAGRPAGATGPTVLVCKGGTRARIAASKLRAAGVECAVVEGGVDACAAAGVACESSGTSRVWSLERQVRLAAGMMAVAGVALGALVHPAGYGLAAFVGLGLAFAAVTDTCGMSMLLARAPWNR
jgi:rhodanese-related sulfurtransferase